MEITSISKRVVGGLSIEVIETEVPEEAKKIWWRCFKYFTPSVYKINLLLTQFLFLVLFCLFLFGILYNNAVPGTEVFALFFLGFLSVIGGQIITLLKLPPLIGMMITGFLFRNLDFIPYYKDISSVTIACLRQIALSYILLMAGLELDGNVLRKLKMVIIRLTFIPCIVEAASLGVFSHYLLDLPWIFSIMLGFIISAISPAIIVPIIINLEEKGYGVRKGIPTLIMAASSLDDILSIAGFTMCFSIAFSTAKLAWTIIKGPLEPLVGFAYGSVFGVIFWYFPSKNRKRAILVYYNVLLVSFAAVSNMFASERLGIPGSGPLGCITVAFVSAIMWRKNTKQFAGVQGSITMLWKIIEPFLFALIGAEVTVKTLHNNAGFGTLSLLLGLICRTITTALVCAGAGFNWKEKIYICCAWLPKATVQAAIGSHVLDYARTHSDTEESLKHGTIILNIAVLSIFITAPVGAILSSVLGPYLLERDTKSSENAEIVKSSSTTALQQEPGPSGYGSIVPRSSSYSLIPKV